MSEHENGGRGRADGSDDRRSARQHGKNRGSADAGVLVEVTSLRDRLEALDREIVRCIAERVRLAEDIGRAKRDAGLPTLDPGREAAVIRRATAMAREEGMEAEDVRDVFWDIVGLCRRAQLAEET